MPISEYRTNAQRLYDAYHDWATSQGIACEPWSELTHWEREAWASRFEEVEAICEAESKTNKRNYH